MLQNFIQNKETDVTMQVKYSCFLFDVERYGNAIDVYIHKVQRESAIEMYKVGKSVTAYR